MSEHKTLLQFLLDLLHNQDALADFREDPQGALHAAGLDHVCVQDIQDLLPVVLEKADPEQCAKYEDDCDNDRCHDDAPRHHEGHHGGHHWSDPGCDDDDKSHHHHESEIDKVVTHLNYVTNNYSFDSHDTVFNTTNITKVWADHGSNVDVNNETHNVGAGGVSIEGDNNAPVATGGHNVIGDGNQLSGDGSTTAFGAGSALSHVGADNGGALSVNGPASGNNAPTTNFGDGAQVAGQGGSASDSHAQENSHNSTDNHSLTDSQNHTSTDSHAQDNSDHSIDTDTSTHDSNNTLSHDDNSVDNSTHADHSVVHDPAFALVP